MEFNQPSKPVYAKWLGPLLVGLVVALPLCCGGGLFWLIYDPWAAMGTEERNRELQELVAHYRPIVEAVHRYEEESGVPPDALGILVPDHLSTLPKLRPGYVGTFEYEPRTYLFEADVLTARWRRLAHVLPRGANADDCAWPKRGRCSGHTHLVCSLDPEAIVRDVWIESATKKGATPPFAPGTLRIGPDDPVETLGEFEARLAPRGRTRVELERALGSPEHDLVVNTSWDITVSFPDGFMDSNAPTFTYYSKWREEGLNQEFEGWTYRPR